MVVFAAPSFRKYILFLQPKPNMTYFPYLFVVFLKERRRDVAYRYLFRRKKSIVNCWTPRPRATGGGGAHSSNRQVFGYAGLLRVIKCSLQCLLHSAPRREIIRYKPGRESLANLTNNFLFVLFFARVKLATHFQLDAHLPRPPPPPPPHSFNLLGI